ncbi:hypothetical protein Angca_000269, partial [Angiostrongylus cantonensis]
YEFLTEEDKIYDLTCTYSAENTSIDAYYDTVNFVAQRITNISMLPTCHYSLRENSVNGAPTRTAMVGQMV